MMEAPRSSEVSVLTRAIQRNIPENGMLHRSSHNVPFIKDVIQEKSINHHDKLGNHSNTILQPLLEQQQRGRLKKLWPVDLLDG
jgi:hypothetical protein